MKYYSQFKQDQFVYENFFYDKKDGYFVDIGAHNGERDSNSLFFEELGWKGICFEPNPEMFNELKKLRKCVCFPYAVSDKDETSTFFQITGNGPTVLSGLADEYSLQAIHRINEFNLENTQEFNYIEVECKTFNSIVDIYNIDFLSLDTEGNELKILKSIDFDKYNIDVITVENNDYDNKFINFLTLKGYKFICRLGCDELYKKTI